MPVEDWRAEVKAHLDTSSRNPVWGDNFIHAVKAIRVVEKTGLRDTLDLMANVFGFDSWPEWQPWLKEHQPDFSMIQGHHAMTLLKMLAIKHGRNVSTKQ